LVKDANPGVSNNEICELSPTTCVVSS
jgi:hypothetical protein